MSNFERRLSSLNRRPRSDSDPVDAASSVRVDAAPAPDLSGRSIGWDAAERLAHMVDVAPGTVIRISVDDGHGLGMFEVAWDDSGVPSIRQT